MLKCKFCSGDPLAKDICKDCLIFFTAIPEPEPTCKLCGCGTIKGCDVCLECVEAHTVGEANAEKNLS